MRHEVTIPFSFDTEPIEQMLANVGEEQVNKLVDQLVEDAIAKCLPTKRQYSGYQASKTVTDWNGVINSRIDRMIEEHMTEIMDEAALILAMRVSKRKAWREILAEIHEGDEK